MPITARAIKRTFIVLDYFDEVIRLYRNQGEIMNLSKARKIAQQEANEDGLPRYVVTYASAGSIRQSIRSSASSSRL